MISRPWQLEFYFSAERRAAVGGMIENQGTDSLTVAVRLRAPHSEPRA